MQCLKKLFHTAQSALPYCNKINIIYRRSDYTVQKFVYRGNHYSNIEFEGYEENEEEKLDYMELSKAYLGSNLHGHRVYVIQPYVKWGVDKKRNTTPELQLEEAVALINTLPNWSVSGKKLVPLLTLEKKKLVGSGALDSLKKEIRSCLNVTAIFVSTDLLKFVQIAELQQAFNLPIYDRYSIVIHIFREHAKTSEAKLQVALAEIPYVRKKMSDLLFNRSGRINLVEKKKKLLESREKKLKNALKKLKEHRILLKKQRKNYGFPTIAVVGYTNAGKTSLIKALTGDELLEPKNKLFATLDTTVHQGYLHNKLKVLFVDTIGFMQDIPETLMEPFIVTLEDAITADLIIHVYDANHPDFTAQFEYVQKTIQRMIQKNRVVINVANKCDLVEKENIPKDVYAVSAVKQTGIDSLRSKIEDEILIAANLIRKYIKVPIGTPQESWLYKEATVTNAEPDANDSQYVIMDVIMSTPTFYKFMRFLKE